MHHTPSAPTPEYGAPDIPVIPPAPSHRGRCAMCTKPIYDTEEAVQLSPARYRALGEPRDYPRPYQHTECPQ